MKHDGYSYDVSARLTLTKREIRDLATLANAHYDDKCRSEALLGGFLFGWINRAMGLEDEQTIEVLVTYRMVDRLCKILEMEHLHTGKMVYRVPWMQLLNQMGEEYRGINGPVTPGGRERHRVLRLIDEKLGGKFLLNNGPDEALRSLRQLVATGAEEVS